MYRLKHQITVIKADAHSAMPKIIFSIFQIRTSEHNSTVMKPSLSFALFVFGKSSAIIMPQCSITVQDSDIL